MSSWDGVERRHDYLNIGEEISSIKTDIAVIKTDMKNLDKRVNGSITEIEKHIEHGKSWRLAIVGIVISVVIQITTFAYLWGQASRQIVINTGRLDVIEGLHRGSQVCKVP
jgi:hypothetical protein